MSPESDEAAARVVAKIRAAAATLNAPRDAVIRNALEHALMFADVFAAVSENHPNGNINAVNVALKCREALKLLPDGRVTDHDIRD